MARPSTSTTKSFTNRYVVERFKKRGVVFVDNISEISRRRHGPVQRARRLARHSQGVRSGTASRHRRDLPSCDEGASGGGAFCPRGLHDPADRPRGTRRSCRYDGRGAASIRLVQDPAEAERLDLPPNAKVAFLTQTTLSVDDAEAIVAVLRKRYPQIVGPSKDDICYATQNRQEAVKDLVTESDVVLVLGSRNSSKQHSPGGSIASRGKPAYLIDGWQEIADDWLTETRRLLITRGRVRRRRSSRSA